MTLKKYRARRSLNPFVIPLVATLALTEGFTKEAQAKDELSPTTQGHHVTLHVPPDFVHKGSIQAIKLDLEANNCPTTITSEEPILDDHVIVSVGDNKYPFTSTVNANSTALDWCLDGQEPD